MNCKKLLLLSVATLLGAVTLTGCGQPSGPDTSAEESETTTEDTRRYNIYFDEEITKAGKNLEIASGSRYLLWKHVSVPSGTYTLTALTDNIEIDGHVIVAKSYGPFKVKITAVDAAGENTKTKSLEGNVVSAEKVEFNRLWNLASESGNYTVESELNATARHNELYNELLIGETEKGDLVYDGNVFDEASGHWYNYQYSTANEDAIEWASGYGAADTTTLMTKDFGIAGADFQEIFDEDGNPTGEFVLKDIIDSEYHDSTKIAPLFDQFFSYGNAYSILVSKAGSVALSASVDADMGEITLAGKKENGTLIKNYTYNGVAQDATVKMYDIGATNHAAIDDWLKNPVYPEAVDVSPISAFFESMATAKNYTAQREGAWVNPQTGKETKCPANLFMSGQTVAPTYFAIDMVDDETLVNIVAADDTSAYNLVDGWGLYEGGYALPAAGEVSAYYVKDGALNLAKGSMNLSSGEITYGAPQTGKEVPSLWETTLTQAFLGEHVPSVSFSNKAVYEDGDYYYFNTNGEDCSTTNKDESLVIFTLSDNGIIGGFTDFVSYLSVDGIDFNVACLMDALFGRTGKEYYFNQLLVLDEQSGILQMIRMLQWSSEAVYVQTWTWGKVGSTVLDDASAALNPKAA